MPVVNLFGSRYMTDIANTSPAKKAPATVASGKVRASFDTVETGVNDSPNSTYKLGRVPTNARILPSSKLYWDDLHAGAGVPTLDAGFSGVDGNITTNLTALNDGFNVTTSGSGTLVRDHANGARRVWELLGLAKDPGGVVDLLISLQDNAADTAGTVSAELYYTVD